jgi:hypothetical protein
MDKRHLLMYGLATLLITGIVCAVWYWKPGGQRQIVERTREIGDGITQPAQTITRNFVPALPMTREKPVAQAPIIRAAPLEEKASPRLASLTVVSAEPQAEPTGPDGPQGAYAPAFRMVQCQLVNTVDSSDLQTPIVGLVTADVWWNGKKIKAANSEVHTQAAVDTVRERISSRGDITFILNEPSGLGRELVVSGTVLDMERDDALDSYGISDGSAGLRGEVIKTRKYDEIKFWAASILSAAAGSASNVFGNRVYTNNNSLGLSALQNGVVSPVSAGTQAAVDRYAQTILDAIEKDGFFIRVPAAKRFYVYVTETIDLAKARVGNDRARLEREARVWENETNREVRRALPVESQVPTGTAVPSRANVEPLLPPEPSDLIPPAPNSTVPQINLGPLLNGSATGVVKGNLRQ